MWLALYLKMNEPTQNWPLHIRISFSEIYKLTVNYKDQDTVFYTARFRLDRLLLLGRELSGTSLLTLEA